MYHSLMDIVLLQMQLELYGKIKNLKNVELSWYNVKTDD